MKWMSLILSLWFAVLLQWDRNSESFVTGYNIYWDTQDVKPYRNIIDVGNNVTGTVSNLPAGSQYYFYVTAKSATAESSPSNVVNVAMPSSPTGINMTVNSLVIQ